MKFLLALAGIPLAFLAGRIADTPDLVMDAPKIKPAPVAAIATPTPSPFANFRTLNNNPLAAHDRRSVNRSPSWPGTTYFVQQSAPAPKAKPKISTRQVPAVPVKRR